MTSDRHFFVCYCMLMSEMQDLLDKLHTEPSTKANRPYLVEFIKRQTEVLRQYPEQERLMGHDASTGAGMICAAIAYNCADEGVEHDDWLDETTEPVLMAIMETTSPLDADGNHPENWKELFQLVDKLS